MIWLNIKRVSILLFILPYCVEQMKHQSLKAGASYWDLYDAMGGKIQCLHGLIMGLLVKIMFIFQRKEQVRHLNYFIMPLYRQRLGIE